ncbi:hypothetical protein AAK894_04385 [Lachnospiraceae bacterium 46-61]
MNDELKEFANLLLTEMRKEIKQTVKEEVVNSMKEMIDIIKDSHNILSDKIDTVTERLDRVEEHINKVETKIDSMSKDITSLKLKSNIVDDTLISHTYEIRQLKEVK